MFYRIGMGVIGLAAFGLGSCAKPSSSVRVGKTTEKQLRESLGEPLASRVSSFKETATVHEYQDRLSFQVEGGIVVAANRDPEPHEAAIQYWKHEWIVRARVETEDRDIPESRDAHGKAFRQLIARSLGLTVEYEPETGRVRRVVEYGTR